VIIGWRALALCFLCSKSLAYGIPPYDAGNLNYLTSSWYYNAIQNQNVANAAERNASAKTVALSRQTTATTLSGSYQPSASNIVAKMAATYPPANRPEAERVFGELLVGYRKIEQQFGIPKHDVAGSVAAFVAGSYMAYRGVDFPDEHFKPLVAQMRQIIGSNPDFAKASNAEKQEMYEQMAILGMFMANTQMALKEKPNPQIAANMRQAAKGYLEQFLKTDADRVQITAQGLVLK
jgi:hypothetical protein